MSESGTGFPVVFLHAFPLSGAMWVENARAVRSMGFRTLVFDFEGFGKSPGMMSGISDTADKVILELRQLGIKSAVFCGLSMGGYVLFEIIRKSPQLVAAIIFCDTNSESDSKEKKNERFEAIKRIKHGGEKEFLETLADSLLSPNTLQNNPVVASSIRNYFFDSEPKALCAALDAMANRKPSNDLLESLNCPTLLIFGEDDPMLTIGAQMHKRISGSIFKTIIQSGHFPNLETPAQFNAELSGFLETNSF